MTPILGIMASSISGSKAITGAYESIASVTSTGSETSLTFSSIAGTYVSLQIRGIARRNSSSSALMRIRFNSDSGSNYISHLLTGDGSTATASSSTASNGLFASNADVYMPSNTVGFGAVLIDIHNYASTSQYKTTRLFAGTDYNSASPFGRAQLASGLWMSTAAITSVTITLDGDVFDSGSTFALYGIKGA
jgi:hypothetical protein